MLFPRSFKLLEVTCKQQITDFCMKKRGPDSVWAISSSKRQVRKSDPKFQCCNFTFLHLPTEIKLHVCGYLLLEDIHTLSTISTDFKKFIDEYYVRKQICLPNDIVECADAGGRYIMSLKVDFRCVPSLKDHSYKKMKPVSKVKRTHCVEAVKLLNLARLNEVVLRIDRDRRYCFGRRLCPSYLDICMMIMGNAPCLQSVDLTLLRCEMSLAIIEKLARNSASLKRVTLRNPTSLPPGTTLLNIFPYSPFQLVRCLFETSKIESLHLLDFNLDEYEEDPHSHLESNTLKELFLRFGSGYVDGTDWLIYRFVVICPELIKLKVTFKDNTDVCLYHLSFFIAPGLIDDLPKVSPRCETYNMRPLREYISSETGYYCCHPSCPFYEYYSREI